MKTTYMDAPTLSMINLSALEGDLYEVNRISVLAPHRGKGLGRRLMQEMTTDADAAGVTLVLDINPYGDMDYEQLSAWYSRNGFAFKNRRWYRHPSN